MPKNPYRKILKRTKKLLNKIEEIDAALWDMHKTRPQAHPTAFLSYELVLLRDRLEKALIMYMDEYHE